MTAATDDYDSQASAADHAPSEAAPRPAAASAPAVASASTDAAAAVGGVSSGWLQRALDPTTARRLGVWGFIGAISFAARPFYNTMFAVFVFTYIGLQGIGRLRLFLTKCGVEPDKGQPQFLATQAYIIGSAVGLVTLFALGVRLCGVGSVRSVRSVRRAGEQHTHTPGFDRVARSLAARVRCAVRAENGATRAGVPHLNVTPPF